MAARPQKLILCLLLICAARLYGAPDGAQGPALQITAAKRIVSIVPAVTEMLFAIGAGPQVVGVSSFDEFPPQVNALPKVGALLDPDVERILALRPDLVIAYGSQTDFQGQLGRAGVNVFNYRHAGLPGIFDTLRRLGPAVGRRDEANSVIRTIESQFARVSAAVRGRPKPRVALIFERDPGSLRGVYVSGGRGFLHEMLEIAGGVNVFGDVNREAVQPSSETLLARAPDVIIELRANGMLSGVGSPEAERRAFAALASVPAVRNNRIHFLNGDYLLVPGPRVGEATEAFARAVHPGAFK